MAFFGALPQESQVFADPHAFPRRQALGRHAERVTHGHSDTLASHVERENPAAGRPL